MGGIFVEAGANDGENISNTLTLERNFGWTGLLVEPDPRALELLKSKHRKAWIAGVGLSTSHVPQKVILIYTCIRFRRAFASSSHTAATMTRYNDFGNE